MKLVKAFFALATENYLVSFMPSWRRVSCSPCGGLLHLPLPACVRVAFPVVWRRASLHSSLPTSARARAGGRASFYSWTVGLVRWGEPLSCAFPKADISCSKDPRGPRERASDRLRSAQGWRNRAEHPAEASATLHAGPAWGGSSLTLRPVGPSRKDLLPYAHHQGPWVLSEGVSWACDHVPLPVAPCLGPHS